MFDPRSLRNGVLLAALLLGTTDGSAQPPQRAGFEAGTFTLNGAAGGAAYSDFLRVLLRAPLFSAGPDRFVDRRVSAETSLAFSGNIAYWVTSWWGLRLNASYSPSRFEVISAESSSFALDSDSPDLPGLGVLLYDFDILFRLPIHAASVTPYGLIGAGRADYSTNTSSRIPLEARSAFRNGNAAEWAAIIGIGAVISLAPSDLRLTFELTNHIVQSPLAGQSDFENAPGVDEQIVSAEASATSNVRLNLGLGVPLTLRP